MLPVFANTLPIGKRAWQPLAGAAVDIDFARGKAYPSVTTGTASPDVGPTQLLSISRASIGYAQTAAGTLVQFPANTLRITDKGLLVEDARTNSTLSSQTFDVTTGGVGWTPSGGTVTADQINAPDGTLTADKVAATSAAFSVDSNSRFSSGAGTVWTLSIYAKAGSGAPWLLLQASDFAANGFQCWYNISTGTMGTPGAFGDGTVDSSSIETLANGWYRLIVSGHFTASHSTGLAFQPTVSADGSTVAVSGDFAYVWGAQAETGSFPSSYIPTTTANATRAADSIPTIGGLASMLARTEASSRFYIAPTHGTTTEKAFFANDSQQHYVQSSTLASVFLYGPLIGVNATINDHTINDSTVCYGWSTSGLSLVGDGLTVSTNATAPPLAAGTTYLGHISPSGNCIFTYIKRCTVWPTRLADSVLQSASVNGTTPPAGYAVDLNFTTGTYTDNTPYPYLSISRASIGYATTAAGALIQFPANTLRYTSNGLLVEDARTNITTQSQDFTSADWTKAGVSTGATTTAPDGTSTARKIVEDASTGVHEVFNGSTTLTAASYTFSIYAKAAERRYGFLQATNAVGANRLQIVVDLLTGTITQTNTVGTITGSSTSVETLGNGWYRLIITIDGTAAQFYHIFGLSDSATPALTSNGNPTYTGDNSSGLYFWGAQTELGSFPSSYIPTTTTSATRAMDAVTTTSALYNLLVGSILTAYADIKLSDEADNITGINIVGNPSGWGEFTIFADHSNIIYNFSATSAVSATIGTGSFVSGVKMVFAGDTSSRSIVAGGGSVGISGTGFVPDTTQNLGGFGSNSTLGFYGYFRRLTVWSSRLANATLQSLTNP